MKPLMALVGLVSATMVSADRVNTRVETPTWSIESSECIWAGARHTSYPLWHLIDGKPETTWAFSGLAYPRLASKLKHDGLEDSVRPPA
jgi:hypothetical protein